MAAHQASTSQFVLRALTRGASDGFQTRAKTLGDTETLKTPEPCCLFKHAQQNLAERVGWNQLRESLGHEIAVLPVFFDERQNPHYPTGRLTVRFKTSPSDADLAEFSKLHDLARWKRNEFVPSQVTFEHARIAEVYFPDLLAEISRDPVVSANWPETWSVYRKT